MFMGIVLTGATLLVIGAYSMACFMTAQKFERAIVRNKTKV